MKCRCANIMTMMCLTLVLIGFACDVTTVTGAVVESCTEENLQKAVDDGGTVTFNCGATATITVTGPILINRYMDVTIDGGGNRIVIDGKGLSRLFKVISYNALTLKGLTLVNGYADGDGGAILSFGGQLTIENCTLANSHATENGGAIWAGHTTITNSTVTDNEADGDGGAIWVGNYSMLRLNRATVSGNTAGLTAGGVYFDGGGSTPVWYDSILAGNKAPSFADCYRSWFYNHESYYSVLGTSRCGFNNEGGTDHDNILNVLDPKLGTLSDNGGPTPTMLPLPGSPAIHNGFSSGYSWGPEDQRGYPRANPYDIGAVESGLVLNPIGNKTVQATKMLTITVTANSDIEDATLTYAASGLPTGATFNADTHTFQWQPTTKQTGSYQVTFTVTDNVLVPPQIVSETITITVAGPNRPPVFDPLSKYNVIVGELLAFTVHATDPDGNSIMYSSSNLPAGATLNATTGLFQWKPSTSGVYKVTFTTTDNGVPAKSSSITTSINVTKK